jgi:hypothetical protein
MARTRTVIRLVTFLCSGGLTTGAARLAAGGLVGTVTDGAGHALGGRGSR